MWYTDDRWRWWGDDPNCSTVQPNHYRVVQLLLSQSSVNDHRFVSTVVWIISFLYDPSWTICSNHQRYMPKHRMLIFFSCCVINVELVWWTDRRSTKSTNVCKQPIVELQLDDRQRDRLCEINQSFHDERSFCIKRLYNRLRIFCRPIIWSSDYIRIKQHTYKYRMPSCDISTCQVYVQE